MRLFPTEEFVTELRAWKDKCNYKSLPDAILKLTFIDMVLLCFILFVWMISAPGMNYLHPSTFDMFIFIFTLIFLVVLMCVFMLWGLFLSDEARKELSGGS